MSAPKPVGTSVPRLEDDREFVDAVAKREELERALAEAESKASGLDAQLLDLGSAAATSVKSQVAALLADPSASLTAVADDPIAIRRELNELAVRQRVIREAIRKQTAVVGDLTRRRSSAICNALKPQHKQLVRAIVNGLAALAEASDTERDFREGLAASGISTGAFDVIALPGIGERRNPHSRVSVYFREACKLGFITPDEYARYTSRVYPQ